MIRITLCLAALLCTSCLQGESESPPTSNPAQSASLDNDSPMHMVVGLEKIVLDDELLASLPSFEDPRINQRNQGHLLNDLVASVDAQGSRFVLIADGQPDLHINLATSEQYHVIKRNRRGELRYRALGVSADGSLEVQVRRNDLRQLVVDSSAPQTSGD